MAAAKELPACPVETTLTLISDKWKVLILRDLLPGTKRFGELKRSVGNVSQKVLTAQLRQMEESGLLLRTVYPEVPPPCRIFPYRAWLQPEARFGRHVGLGRKLQAEKLIINRKEAVLASFLRFLSHFMASEGQVRYFAAVP